MNTDFGWVTAIIAGVFLLFVLFKIFTFPIKLAFKLIINGVIGIIILLITNAVGGFLGIQVAITPLNAIIAGLLGLPGVILIILYGMFF